MMKSSEAPVVLRVEKIRLDSGGYVTSGFYRGRYFGNVAGTSIFRVTSDDGDHDHFIRAANARAARAKMVKDLGIRAVRSGTRRKSTTPMLRERARAAIAHAREIAFGMTAGHRSRQDAIDAIRVAMDAALEAGYEKTAAQLEQRLSFYEGKTTKYRHFPKTLRDPRRAARETPRRTPKKSRTRANAPYREQKEKATMAGMPKRRARRAKSRARDRGWRGDSREHASASRKGWRRHAKPSWSPKRRRNARDSDSRDWPKARRRHAQAAARGWKVTGKRGWRPKKKTWKGSTASTGGFRKTWRRMKPEHRRHHNIRNTNYNFARGKGAYAKPKRGRGKRGGHRRAA